jgi:hypothetical protein
MGSSPPPPYGFDSFPPPHYGSKAVYGISLEVDKQITGSAPEPYLSSCVKTSQLSAKSKLHRSKIAALTATKKTLAQVFCLGEPGSRCTDLQQVLRLASLPVTIANDIIKPPYHLARMGVAISKRNVERHKAEEEVVDEIIESLLTSLEAVSIMLVRLGLETPESLKRQTRGRGLHDLLALARFLEAFGSRFAPPSTIYLASGKVLPKEHCSGAVRLHFDQIHLLKDEMLLANLPPTHTLPDASTLLEQRLPRALKVLKGTKPDRNEDRLFLGVLQVLREVRDELPGLVTAESKVEAL